MTVAEPRSSEWSDELTARLSRLLMATQTVTAAVEVLTAMALQTIGCATGAGVSLMDDHGRRLSTAATSQFVVDADEAQYRCGQGPCLTAWAERRTVRVDDIHTDRRWPRWTGTARSLRVRATVSAPLIAEGRVLGAVKVYSPNPGVFDEETERLLSGIGDTAAVLLVQVAPSPADRVLNAAFEQAMRQPDAVQLARNIVMRRFRMSAGAAVRLLVDEARTTGLPIYEVASSIVKAASDARPKPAA